MDEMTREYSTDAIAVQWYAGRCIHSAWCIRSLPQVFNPRDRPWVHIHIEEADADAIAAAVMRCPTGALHFRRLDGGPQEQPPEEPSIQVVPRGPLYVRGDIELLGQGGEVIRRDTRMALCRCGHSASKPFCDNSHLRTGFNDRAGQRPRQQAP